MYCTPWKSTSFGTNDAYVFICATIMLALVVATGTVMPASLTACSAVPNAVPGAQMIIACGPSALIFATCALTLVSAALKCSVASSVISLNSGNVSALAMSRSPIWPEASVVFSVANFFQPLAWK